MIANRRIDELQAALTEERRRLIAVLTGPVRVPWWRRWFPKPRILHPWPSARFALKHPR
jgi:hypothetical protein